MRDALPVPLNRARAPLGQRLQIRGMSWEWVDGTKISTPILSAPGFPAPPLVRHHRIRKRLSLTRSLLMATIPDALDIANALEDLAAGLRLDPDAVGIDRLWLCVLSDVTTGEQLRAGIGLTMREAAADAWVASLRVEQLIDSILGRIPPPMPDGRWRFELAQPGCWERVAVERHHSGEGPTRV